MYKNVDFISHDGEPLALHSWTPRRPQAVIFYIHGIQSHGGWLFETGPELANLNIATYVLDRRGSGKSGGLRGDIDHYMTWIKDYVVAINFVKRLHSRIPLIILGQSFGGGLLAGIIANGQAIYDGLLFCAPAINQSATLPKEVLKKIQKERRAIKQQPNLAETYLTVPLEDMWYTTDRRYLSFMKADKLMVRKTTLRLRLAMADLERSYMAVNTKWPASAIALVVPRRDKIINLEVAKNALQKFTNYNFLVLQAPVEDHYIEFSHWRKQYLCFLAWYAKSCKSLSKS